MQLEKYLADRDLNFSEFVNALIGQKIRAEFQTVSSEIIEGSIEPKKKQRAAKQPPKADPAVLFQIGRIGNNINQIAKFLNFIRQDLMLFLNFLFLNVFIC